MISLKDIEKCYVVFSMLFFANGVVPRAVAESDMAGQMQPVIGDKIGLWLVCVILGLLVIVHWRRVLAGLQQASWIIALCGLALVSAGWSYDAAFTARRGIVLGAVTMFAIYIASCFEWDEQLDLFGWMSVIAVLGSVFMAVFVPYYGISHDLHMGSVKGLFPHRSIMARQMVFAILTLWLGKPKGIPSSVRRLTLTAGAVLLVLSHAATSVIVMLLCLAAYPVAQLMRVSKRRTLPLWVPLAPLFGIGIYLVLSNFGFVLAAADRDSTLTGRTAIWHYTLEAIGRHPWFGYGYDVFWNRYTPELARVTQALQFRPPHAHDGYLDILLAIGAVGFVVFLGGFTTNLWRAFRLFRDDVFHGAKWPLFVLLFFTVFNFTESNILRPLTFLWIPYVSIYVSLGLLRVEAEAKARCEIGERESVTPRGIGDLTASLPGCESEGFAS
jgi:exopolysaccharide production protein ExoQ